MSATVFITNMGSHDYSSSARFGAARPITQGNFPIFKTERLLEEIVRALLGSEPSDYLLISGAAGIASLCLAVWLILHKRAQLLLYDEKQDSYVPRTITREELAQAIEELRHQRQETRHD